jgi:hypothetical protein
MAKNKFDTQTFIISGALILFVLSGLLHLTANDFGFRTIIILFLYGGMLGIMAKSKHTSFIKNVSFFSLIFFILWTITNPLDIVSGSTIIDNMEFWILALIAVLFLDREIWNAVRRAAGKPQTLAPTFIGSMAILIVFQISGISELLFQYWQVMAVFLVFWFIILYFIVGKQLDKLGAAIIKRLER